MWDLFFELRRNIYKVLSEILFFENLLVNAVEMGFPGGLVVKNPPASAGDAGSMPGSGRSHGGGHGDPLQCPCLKNPMNRGAWWAMVHSVAKSQTRLEQLNVHT